MSTRLRKRTTAVWTRKTTQIYLLSSSLKLIDPMCRICLNKSKTPLHSYLKHILIYFKKSTFCQLRRVHRTSSSSNNVGKNNESPCLGKAFKSHKIQHCSGERQGLIRHVKRHETFNLRSSSQLKCIDRDYAQFSWRKCYSRILNLDLQSELFSKVV